MLALKLVLDTNILVSGLLKPQGLERAVVTFAVTAPVRLFVSREIMDEYARVLPRPILHIDHANVHDLLQLIQQCGVLISPSTFLDACSDPDDNKFLECATEARADYLITGNKRHFPNFWRNTKIINAREFLEIVAPHLLS